MTSRRWISGLLLALVIAVAAGRSVDAQWHTSILALRTNGSVMRPGDCVRLDLLSLDAMPVPLATRVTYRYTEPITVKDEDGKETTTTRPATRALPASPLIDALAPLQRLPLDDTFCFGEGSLPGAYQVEVALLPSASGAPVATLRTCVVFDNAITAPEAAPARPSHAADCALHVRGVKRAEPGGTVYFDGNFPASGLYKVALIRNNRIEAVLDGGAYQSGPRELIVSWPVLETASGADADLVILDGATGASTTLARVTVPRGN
jgi:hypothetical protein